MDPLNQTVKLVEKTNKSVLDFFENPFVKYGFLIFVVLRIIFISDMEEYYMNLFNYPIIKITYALLIAYSACFDPVYAIALTTLIIITYQELYRRQANGSIVSGARGVVGSNSKKPFLPADVNPLAVQSVTIDKMPDQALLIKDAMVFNEINKHALQRTPDPKDSMIAEYDFYQDPAYRTITANLEGKDYLGHNNFFITDNNLNQIQTNQEPGSNQNQSVQAFPRVINIQGLPNGFDKGVGGSNTQLAELYSA